MRATHLLGLTTLAALAGGCAAVDSDLQYRGTLNTPTNGVVLFEDGELGHAGMAGTTCVVTPDGRVANDVDIDRDDDEEVVDGSVHDGGVVLARTRGELHVMSRVEDFNPGVAHIPVAGVTDARFTGPGAFAALTDCAVEFFVDDGNQNWAPTTVMPLTDMGCASMDPSFEIDDATGTAYVGNDSGIFAVSPDATTRLADRTDHVVYAADLGALALADSGTTQVSLVGTDGAERWSADLPGTVHDVFDLGARDAVGVMVARDGQGTLMVLEASSGEVRQQFDLPDVADVVAAANGHTLALVLDDVVHYYNLR
jgi:hypothetical protein